MNKIEELENKLKIANAQLQALEKALAANTERACKFNCDAAGTACVCPAHEEYRRARTLTQPGAAQIERLSHKATQQRLQDWNAEVNSMDYSICPTHSASRLNVFRRKVLRFRRGNYSSRYVVPLMEYGPFRSFVASWRWGQIEYGLRRWY